MPKTSDKMKQAITVKTRITDNPKILENTMEKYSQAIQYCMDIAWDKGIHTHNDIQKTCYYEIRKKYGLQSQLAINATKQASEIMKKAETKPKVKKYMTIRYNFPRSATVNKEWGVLSLATINGRKKFEITIPEYFEKYLDWEVKESNLIRDSLGRIFFYFVFSKEIKIKENPDGKTVGIDLGINKLAVTSNGEFYGTEMKKKRKKWDKLVAELQSKGTHKAHKRLEAKGFWWKRLMIWKNHNISRKIVDSLSNEDVIVMEDLANIRKTLKYNKWVHRWAFRQLQTFIEYKANLKGIKTVYIINPKYTSQECSKCGSKKTNRNNGFFECQECGYKLDADLNASRNIAQRYKRDNGLAGNCKLALGSGENDSDAKQLR